MLTDDSLFSCYGIVFSICLVFQFVFWADSKHFQNDSHLFMSPQAEMIYMSAILQTYDKILNQMLKQLPTPSPTTAQTSGDKGAAADTTKLRTQLNYILEKITTLRRLHYNKPEQLLKKLQPLTEVQVRTYITERLMDVRLILLQ